MVSKVQNGFINDKGESSLDFPIYGFSSEHEEQDIANQWSPYLYSLQRRAPKSRILPVENEINNKLSIMGLEYHGLMSKADAIKILLGKREGTFLLRQNLSGEYVVSFRFSDKVKHYIVKCDGTHFLHGDKQFTSVNDLVDDSLITLFLEQQTNVGRYLTIGRVKQQNKLKKVNTRKGLRNMRVIRSSGSPKYLHSDNSLYEDAISPNGNDYDLVQVHVDEVNIPAHEDQELEERHVTKHKMCPSDDSFGNQSKTNTKNSAREVVNLLRAYTITSPTLDRRKSISAGNLADHKMNGAISQLVKNTLTVRSTEDLSRQENSKVSVTRSSSTSSYEKAHNFKVITYQGPTWCDMCHHFLWGLVQQGLRCQDCGINVHRQCMEDDQDTDCIPHKKLIKRVFGIDLTTVVLVDNNVVPKFLKQGTAYLDSKGLEVEGIYRVPGRTLHIMELKDKVNENGTIDFSQISVIHTVSGAIKLFLRELPIPLITFDAYPVLLQCIKAPQSNEMMCSTMKQLLTDHLPKAHYDTLKHFVHHLTRVVAHSSCNKMESSNLAVVFAPTIMRNPNGDETTLSFADIALQKKLVEFLIDNYFLLFEP